MDITHSPDCTINHGFESCSGNLVHMLGFAECKMWEYKSQAQTMPSWVKRRKHLASAKYLYQVTKPEVIQALHQHNSCIGAGVSDE